MWRKTVSVKTIWNPATKGLSVSALNLFWINPVAFELKYFQGLEPVEPWNKNTAYGSLIGAGIEGWIKRREESAIVGFIDNQMRRDLLKFNEYDDIVWWSQLATAQAKVFCSRYSADFDRYKVTRAETKRKETIVLPSGREITLNGYLDGEGKDIIFEHKCRGDWNTERIANEIDMDLQYNYYLLLYYTKEGKLPKHVWYQHSRRPSGFGYRGPKKKDTETKDTYLKRLIKYIQENEDDHFYQFMAKPDMGRFQRFLSISLYPKLEQFLDWYDYLTAQPQFQYSLVPGEFRHNSLHVMTPYGLYNPYLEGTDENFRHYALTGSTLGLRKRTPK